MNKRLLALILVFLMCLSVIHLPNELGFQAKSFSDSDGDGFDDSVDPCPDSQYEWSLTEVDSNPKAGYSSTSLVVDENDRPHIAYHDGTDKDLQYAWHDGDSWNKKELESTGDTGYAVSMALNSNADPLVAYVDNTGGAMTSTLKLYNVSSDEIFSYNGVYSGGIYQATGFTINDQDAPILTYRVENNFEWLEFDSDGNVDGGAGQNLGPTNSYYVEVTSDSLGNQPVVWQKSNYELVYKSDIGLTSSQEIVISNDRGPGGFISLTTDHNDNPHMIYRVEQDSRLQYSYSTDLGSTWSHEIIESVSNVPYYYTSIKIDSQNNPHIVYSAYQEAGFRYAYRNSTGWDITELNGVDDSLNIQGGGNWLSMDLDSYDSPHISFHDSGSNSLKYALLDKKDSDNDGCLDSEDAFPNDAYEQFDDDGNGVGDNEDYSGRVYNISPVNGTYTGGTEVIVTGSGFEALLKDEEDSIENYSSLVGHWKMEDSSGALANSAGNNHDAGDVGTLDYSQPGIIGDSIDFSGTKHAIVTHHQDLVMTNKLTVMGWINPNNPITAHEPENGSPSDSLQCLIGKWPNSYILCAEVENIGFRLANPNTNNPVDGTGKNFAIVTAENPVPHNTWTHLAGTYDGQVAILYVNGEEVGREYTTELIGDDQDNLYIGADSYSGSYNFADARLDEVMLFNESLNAESISSYFENTRRDFVNDSMLGHWKMDGYDTENHVEDSSGNDWDALPYGGPSFDQQGVHNDSTYFDGVDDYLLPAGADFSGLDQMSISAWINPSSLHTQSSENKMIMTHNDAWYFYLKKNSTHSQLVWSLNGNSDIQSTTSLTTNTWYHVAGSWDGTYACVYINAVAEGCRSYPDVTSSMASRSTSPNIGAQGANSNWFHGYIDDLRLYGASLASSEIEALYEMNSNNFENSSVVSLLQARFSTSDWSETVNLTYVDNNTLTLTTPQGPEAQTVNLTLIGANGQELLLPDAYTFDSTAIDSDGDSFLDDVDDCPSTFGNSTADRIGCLDSDGDGYSDIDGSNALQDKFPFDATQWSDYDDDNYGDNYANQSWEQTRPVEWPGVYVEGATEQDACPGLFGNSTAEATYGCPDSDGDTYADKIDSFADDDSQWSDIDGDGYGDNSSVNATTPDSCPSIWGNSTFDRYGCQDSDGDGMSDEIDDFPLDAERTSDVDQDGLDDRFDDNCPNTYNPLQEDLDGDGMGDLCDTDEDGDGIHDGIDNCPQGITDWTSGVLLDYDGDGCLDGAEDSDDDGDGVVDGMDGCPKGDFGWESSLDTDHDSDGCNDESEDLDDDADGKDDSKDSCPKGANDWSSTTLTDLDADGCRDSDEDLDDDGDGVNDENDSCPTGLTQWVSDPMSDADADGCHDELDDSNEPDVVDESESFVDLLASGNLDAIGIVLAITLPIIGISLSVMLRRRKSVMIQNMSDKVSECKTESELDALTASMMDLVTKDSISQAQYDVLKFKIEGRRSAIHSETYLSNSETSIIESNVPDLTAVGYDGNDGYEWLDYNGSKWYRSKGTYNEWIQWGN